MSCINALDCFFAPLIAMTGKKSCQSFNPTNQGSDNKAAEWQPY
jgi:hypothetical protein